MHSCLRCGSALNSLTVSFCSIRCEQLSQLRGSCEQSSADRARTEYGDIDAEDESFTDSVGDSIDPTDSLFSIQDDPDRTPLGYSSLSAELRRELRRWGVKPTHLSQHVSPGDQIYGENGHRFEASGTCALCGRSREAIAYFKWACFSENGQS